MQKTPQKTIEAHFQEKLKAADLVIRNFPWEIREAYAGWLAQQYFLVRHSVRLLALAISKIDNNEIRNEYVGHLIGERGHEQLLLKDLRSFGYKIEDFSELPSTRLLVHNQYYWLQNSSPDVLFGYAQYLEGISVFSVPSVIKRLEKIGVQALSFLKVHADSDEDHYPEGFKRIHAIGENAADLILPNLGESHLLYTQMFFEIEESLGLAGVDVLGAAGMKKSSDAA